MNLFYGFNFKGISKGNKSKMKDLVPACSNQKDTREVQA